MKIEVTSEFPVGGYVTYHHLSLGTVDCSRIPVDIFGNVGLGENMKYLTM